MRIILVKANKVYLLLSESDQGGVNNLHTRKKFLQHNKEQIIDNSRERGRCVVVEVGCRSPKCNPQDYLEVVCQRYTWCNPPSIGIAFGE